jgi:hypothetical protein
MMKVWELGERGGGGEGGLLGTWGRVVGGWERGNTHLIPMINTRLDVIIPTSRVKGHNKSMNAKD